jgi:hypothetical protein
MDPPKLSFIQYQKVVANTCSKLYTRARANGRKREEWERSGIDLSIVTVH